jgi:hypothetical protein
MHKILEQTMTHVNLRISKIDFAMLSLMLLGSIFLAAMAYFWGGMDFGVYYAAGRVLLKGGNPYDYSQLAGEIVSSTGVLNNPFYYAPWFAWAMSVLALLPYEIARLCWALLNFSFWFLGIHNLYSLVDWPPAGWRRWGAYLFVTILFAWSTWGAEQVGVLIFFLITLFLLAYRRGKWVWAGGYLALLLFKPNITAMPVVFLSIWMLLHREWKPVASMFGVAVMLIAISLFVTPEWYAALFQPDKLTGLSYTLNEAGETQVLRYTTTLLDWLAAYGISGAVSYGIYVLTGVAGFVFMIWHIGRSTDVVGLMAFALLVNFALIPYALFYDYSLMTLTLFFVNFKLKLQPSKIWLQRLANLLIFASLFVGDNISYRYWIVVILVVAVIFGRVYVEKIGD